MSALASLEGHQFELCHLSKQGEHWLIEMAVDGRKLPAFYEPACNVIDMTEDERMLHFQDQALGMAAYYGGQSIQ